MLKKNAPQKRAEQSQYRIHDNRVKQRKVRYISVDGQSKSVSDWIRFLGISKTKVYKILNTGGESAFVDYIKEVLQCPK